MTTLSPLDNTASLYRAGQARIDGATRGLKDASTGTKLDAKTLKQIDGASKEFEASFMSEMLKPMFEGVEVDQNFGGGKGEEVFRDFLLQEYGKKMTQAGGIGIASVVRDQMIRQQEGTVK